MEFSAESIRKHLKHPGLIVEVYDSVDSTNTLLKARGYSGAPHGLVIAAAHQTHGRGRMGRSFYSPDHTGTYFSILLRPDLSPTNSLLITTAAAVACARAIEHISGKKAEIKWVNDIYVDGKKVCGILTEAALATDGKHLNFAVLGIGMNLHSPAGGFPEEIRDRAGSLFSHEQKDRRTELIAEVLNEFFTIYPELENRSFTDEYRSRSMLDGKPVNVIKANQILPATALYIAEDLTLVVQYSNGSIEHLSSGDVSIRTL
ncbi:MAG: biotin--[acetyl-CoA-carboxylase] ligase [Oscillospiraceae bacterium]|nr:biotin--[acetyl-CoA-carboxylase] ligase [Oscillospiraceae bacterium]